MFGINNNTTPIQGPTPTFSRNNYNAQPVSGNNQGQVNAFGQSDTFNVDNTSKAFDQAMSKLTGKPISFDQPQTQMAPSSSNNLPQGISQEEIDWAMSLEAKVKQGYQPTQQEAQAYKMLENKLANSSSTQAPAQNSPTQQQLPISQQELNWALELEAKAKQGYQPTQQEKDTYTALAQKLSQAKTNPTSQTSSQASAPKVSQEEIQWALALEEKVKQGYQPTPQETSTYQDLAHRLQSQKQSGQTQPVSNQSNANRDWSSWSQPFTVPKTLFETTPRIIQVPTTLRSASPSLPTYSAYNQGPTLSTQSTSTGNVTKAEIDWALALEDKVKKGYSPNQGEIAQYKSIFEKMQASKGSTVQQPNQQQPAQSTSLGNRVKNAWAALTGS